MRVRPYWSNGDPGRAQSVCSVPPTTRIFSPLSNNFVSQDNKIFCGPASSAMVLNALRLGKKEGLPHDRKSIDQDELARFSEA